MGRQRKNTACKNPCTHSLYWETNRGWGALGGTGSFTSQNKMFEQRTVFLEMIASNSKKEEACYTLCKANETPVKMFFPKQMKP